MPESPSPPSQSPSKRAWRVLVILAAAAILIGHAYFNPPRQVPDEPRRERVPTINLDRESAKSNSDGRVEDSAVAPAESADDETTAVPREARASRDSRDKSSTADSFVFHNLTIKNEDGRVVFRGDVDVGPTLKRIDAGERLSFSHDGIVFQNREGRLAKKPAGHYHEFVHPTPKLSGPGPQRVITGKDGAAFYTPDHYQTFRRLR